MRTVVQFGLVLSAGLVLAVLVLSAFFAVVGGAESGFMVLIAAGFAAVLALPAIWLGVFVVFVVRKAARVSREL